MHTAIISLAINHPRKCSCIGPSMRHAQIPERLRICIQPTQQSISCRSDIDPDDCIVPITPYVVMRVGKVKLLPYVRPGDPAMGGMIRDLKGTTSAVLLANHGPVVTGPDLQSAVFAAEELEETAKVTCILQNRAHNILNGYRFWN